MASSSSASSQSCSSDVFLSFSEEDAAVQAFVNNLYSALVDEQQICVYKDDRPLSDDGESTCLSRFDAIKVSRIAVVIFSKNYADSSLCLDELTHIMKNRDERGLIVIPVFYGVYASEVRQQKGDFGKAFAAQEAKNVTKAESWRKAHVDASELAGLEIKHIIVEGHESHVIKEIVHIILDELAPLSPYIDEGLVGMTDRLQELESLLDIGLGDVRMVGIWGVGGGGKTTLAHSLFIKISRHFECCCFVENVREATSKWGLKKLQEHMLTDVLKRVVKVHSITEGMFMIKRTLCHKKVLVILDGVDALDQLDALARNRKWFGSGSRILITTRDEHLLRVHKVDHIYRVRLLSDDEAIQLLKKHAYNEEDPVEDYETLSLRVVSYASGLPLALKVLGSFLCGKSKNEWISTLDRLKYMPDPNVMDILKTGYDALETYQKELFLDIACFFRGWNIYDATEILEACDFHPKIGIKVLIQKALISIVDGRFHMNDMVQEMGWYIVRGKHPVCPEKHSRVWKHEEIRNMRFEDATMENDKIETIRYDGYSRDHDHSSHFCEIVSKMKKLRLLSKAVCTDRDVDTDGPSFLSNELRYIHWELYPASPFPDSFILMKLVVLELWGSLQKEVWKGCKHLPRLKVLQLKYMWELLNTPDFDGLPRLEKLTLCSCKELEDIHPSLGNHTSLEYLSVSDCPKLRRFPKFVRMKNLKTLEIKDCFLRDGEIPSGIGELSNLQELSLCGNDFSRLDFSLSQLTELQFLDLSYCVKLLELPELPSNLSVLKADYCSSLTTTGDCYGKCEQLCHFSLMGGGIINDGGGLLQSMLEGKAIENDCMLLRLKGLEVAKGFSSPLFRGRRCRLQLPENWRNDFCGLLIGVVWPNYFHQGHDPTRIIMSHVMSGMDSEDDVVWKESDADSDKHTFVWYVSFGSLRRIKWWDLTYEALEFNIEDYKCCGLGVRLVAKKSESALTETWTYFSNHTPRLEIEDNLESAALSLSFYDLKP